MKKTILLLSFLLNASIAFCQNEVAGFWALLPEEGEYFTYDGLWLTENGYYYSEKVYPEEYRDLVQPEFSLGIYEVKNGELKLYDMKGDRYLNFQINILEKRQLQLRSPNSNETSSYNYQSEALLNENMKKSIRSWENFRKIGGTWKSNESTIKAIPSLGIIIILNNKEKDYFNWGHYFLEGNELSIKAISAGEELIYAAQITSFNQTDFTLENEDGKEQFNYVGKLNLNEKEMYMVRQYMKMNNRLSMTTIDMMDGVQDFIWVRESNHRY